MSESKPPAPVSEPLAARVKDAFEHDLDTTHQSLLRAWIAFGITFALVRALTYSIREEIIPNVNLATEGLHIHHYVWGVALLMLMGHLALVDDRARHHKWLSIMYGVGSALIIDEFALLLNLEDVYWAEEGRWSVDIALALIASFGTYLVARKFWHHVAREVIRTGSRIGK